jgi:hypothetical protein
MRDAIGRLLVVMALLGGVPDPARGADATDAEARALFDAVLGTTPTLRGIAAEPERYRAQILFAEIVDGPGGIPTLRRYAWREDTEYWYPASTVKLCAAVAALRTLERLGGEGAPWLDADTPAAYHPLLEGEAEESADASSTDDGRLTVRHDVRKSLIVSDNPAFNRLYGLAGQDRVNAEMRALGLDSVWIVHRLAERRTAEENRRSPRITLGDGDDALTLPERVSDATPPPAALGRLPGAPGLRLGRAHVGSGGEVVAEPMSFAGKNHVTLRDLQSLIAMVARPDVELGLPALGLSDEHMELLRRAVTDDPSESESPRFDPAVHPDEWPHFFRPGVERVAPRAELRVSNKIGLAYGFASETAYIEHVPSGRAFFLAMCVYVNDNAVLNDGVYEYDLAFRAMEDVAEALARRVFALPERGDAPAADGLIDAPSRWRHERRRVVGSDGVGVGLRAGQAWTSDPIRPGRAFTEMVVSWNVDAPADAGARLEVRARAERGAWSGWLSIGETGRGAPADGWVASSGGVRTEIDTLMAAEPRALVQLRIRAGEGWDGAMEVRRLDACFSSPGASPARVRDDRLDGRVVADTPYRANTLEDAALRRRVCSPLSLRMALAAQGVDATLEEVMGRVYDERFGIYGNWTRAIQAAHELGAGGYLTRFGDWASVRRHLAEVGPLVVSVRFDEGEVANAPYGTSNGHLIVLYGLDERGDALVLDPALSPERESRRVYARDEMSEVWLRRVKGLAYVVLPPRSP